MTETELIEQLADKEHAGWAHWMDYLFSRCEPLPDGSMVIPFPLVERWQRQIATPYAELSEREKQSDRDEVAHILPLIVEYAYGKGDGLTIVKRALDFRKAVHDLQITAGTTQEQLGAMSQPILYMASLDVVKPEEPS